jgi:hypothetical protein
MRISCPTDNRARFVPRQFSENAPGIAGAPDERRVDHGQRRKRGEPEQQRDGDSEHRTYPFGRFP